MLQQLRSSAASLVAKLLMVLLIISFAAWGVTGYITQVRQDNDVATIGDTAITTKELGQAFQREINQYRAQGIEITAEQARGLGLLDQLLDRMIAARVYEKGGEWLGMAVGDSEVRGVIAEIPSFMDETGRFSRGRYEFALNQSGISEGQFVADVRRDILRRQIINSFDFPDKAPDALAKALHRWRDEKRVADFVQVPVDPTLDVGEPDAETLAKLHDEQADRFTAPERRRISYLLLNRERALREIVVTEEQLRQRYQENLAAYTTPEERTVQQILVSDEATAQKVVAAIREGRTFEAVAKDVAAQEPAALDLGTFSAATFPDPQLWDTVAALAQGKVSEPRESSFGWHIFRVTKIIPESVKPFDDVRAKIEEELKGEQVANVLYDLSHLLEDELAGGATLEEAATKLDVPLQQTAPIDSSGVLADGQHAAGLPGGDFLETAFLTESGEMSYVTQVPQDGYYVLRTDEVIPSALRPLEEVRDEVAGLWKDEKRRDAARERALAIVTRIENGESLAEIASAEGLTVTESKPFDRRGGGANSPSITPILASDVFKLQPGQATMTDSPDGFTVAQLKTVVPADPAKPGEIATVLANQMMSDVLVQFNNGLREQFGVAVDRTALNRL